MLSIARQPLTQADALTACNLGYYLHTVKGSALRSGLISDYSSDLILAFLAVFAFAALVVAAAGFFTLGISIFHLPTL